MLLSLVLPAAWGNRATTPAPSGGHPGQPETPGGNEGGDPGETSLKIGITVGSRTITATMEDNAAARISFAPAAGGDVVGLQQRRENILSLTGADDLQGRTQLHPLHRATSRSMSRGAMWPYSTKSGSRSNDLIRIGRIDGNGIDALGIPGSLSVRFERQRRKHRKTIANKNPA